MHAHIKTQTMYAHIKTQTMHAHIKTHLPDAKMPVFEDSLPLIRKSLKLKNNSLLKVYKHLFKETFKAHHALDDARALQRVCKHLDLFKHAGTPLLRIHGVGPKSEQVFKSHGIHTVEQLMEWVKTHKISDWTFKVHASARLAKRLFAGEVLVRSIV